jgi:hypothetical protein
VRLSLRSKSVGCVRHILPDVLVGACAASRSPHGSGYDGGNGGGGGDGGDGGGDGGDGGGGSGDGGDGGGDGGQSEYAPQLGYLKLLFTERLA